MNLFSKYFSDFGKLFIYVSFFVFSQNAVAGKVRGGELHVEEIQAQECIITGVLYYDLTGLGNDYPYLIEYYNAGTDTLFYFSADTLSGIIKVIYKDTLTLPGPGTYSFSISPSNRYIDICNIPGSVNIELYIKAVFISPTFFTSPNSLPYLNNDQRDISHTNGWMIHDLSPVFNTGDSLTFSFEPPMGTGGNPIPGYFYPIGDYYITSAGVFYFKPTLNCLFSFLIRIDEWKNGAIIGTVFRDMIINYIYTEIKEYSEFDIHINIFPNPTDGLFTLEINQNSNSSIEIIVYNLLGELVYSETAKNETGITKRQIDISGFSKGMYLVQVQAGKNFVSKKVVIR